MGFWYKLFTDRGGNPSNKRMTGFVATIMFVYLVLIDTLWDHVISPETWGAVVGLIGWSIGASLLEKPKGGKNELGN